MGVVEFLCTVGAIAIVGVVLLFGPLWRALGRRINPLPWNQQEWWDNRPTAVDPDRWERYRAERMRELMQDPGSGE